jgi:hypothetical protein
MVPGTNKNPFLSHPSPELTGLSGSHAQAKSPRLHTLPKGSQDEFLPFLEGKTDVESPAVFTTKS